MARASALVLIIYGLGTWLTWRKWPDLLVDFGEQLYLPWRISAGSVLYRDVMYLTGGPLSQYYHAALFKVFGVSFLTLIVSNLAIGLGLLLLMYRRFLACSDALTATTHLRWCDFGFGFRPVQRYRQLQFYRTLLPRGVAWRRALHPCDFIPGVVASDGTRGVRNRNWYLCRTGFYDQAGRVHCVDAGLCAGCTLGVMQRGFRAVSMLFIWTLVSASLPVLGFLIYFHQFESWQASARSVAFAWVPLLTTSVSKEVFYKWCMGLDVPGFHLRAMFKQFVVISLILAACAFWFRREMNSSAKRLLTIGFIALLVALASGVDWVDSGRTLPLLVLLLGVLFVVKYRAVRRDVAEAGRAVPSAPIPEMNQRAGNYHLSFFMVCFCAWPSCQAGFVSAHLALRIHSCDAGVRRCYLSVALAITRSS